MEKVATEAGALNVGQVGLFLPITLCN